MNEGRNKVDAVNTQAAGYGVSARPLTVEENINRMIDEANRNIAGMIKARDEARRLGIADRFQSELAGIVYPGSFPF